MGDSSNTVNFQKYGSPATFTLSVFNTPVQVTSESTSQPVINAYNTLITPIVAFFNTFTDSNGNPIALPMDANGNTELPPIPSTLVNPATNQPYINPATNKPFTSWVDLISQSAAGLLSLAQNGVTTGGTTSNITYGMGTSIDALLDSLQSVGFNFNPPSTGGALPTNVKDPQNQALMHWSDLSSFGLQGIIQTAAVQGNDSISLQWMLQVDYIQTANNIITNSLSSLQQAVTINQQVLQTLSNIQNLHNSIAVQNKTIPSALAAFGAGTTTFNNLASYTAAYKALTSPLFSSPIMPVVNTTPNTPGTVTAFTPSDPSSQTIMNQFTTLKQQLSNEIAQLSALNPPSTPTGTSTGVTPSTTAASTLVTSLQTVLQDMSPVGANGQQIPDSNVFQQAMTWLLDGQGNPKSTITGQYQQDIVNASNTASSFNSTQQQNLNAQLFLMQEFYQSASALLSTLNTEIIKIAGGASGR